MRLSLFIAIIAMSLSACSRDLTPIEVAERFWSAVQSSDAAKVKRYVSHDDAEALESLDDVLPIEQVKLGRTVIDSDRAVVATTATLSGDNPVDMPINTYLLLEDGRWKIDYDQTISSVRVNGQIAEIISKVRDFGKALQDGIDKSVAELERSLPKIESELKRLESELKQKVPELRQKLEGFARDLEDAIKEALPAEESAPQQTIEI
jgi:hypothetical protein